MLPANGDAGQLPLTPTWEAGGRELQFGWSEAGFPAREGGGGTVTLNSAACKPEIGLPEAAQGEGGGRSRAGLHLLGQAMENLPPTTGQLWGAGGGGAQNWPSLRGGPACSQLALLELQVRPGSSGGHTWLQSRLQKSTLTKV